jgi:small-conductance mechanosensitive channel
MSGETRIIVNALAVIVTVLQCIVLERHGVPFWKGLIPIYGQYIFARDVAKAPEWGRKSVILSIVVIVLTVLLLIVCGGALFKAVTDSSPTYGSFVLFSILAYFAIMFVLLIYALNISKHIYASYNEIHGHDQIYTYIAMFMPIIAFTYYVLMRDGEVQNGKD